MPAKRPSWKEIIDKRRQENFVGRGDYVRLFSENFATEVPTYLLFSVVGEGGVGKSTLLKQYETSTTDPSVDAIVVICDVDQLSPAAAMGHIAEQLARRDIKHKDFDERYKTYRARREEIESDPKAPRGALNLVVQGMTDFAIKAARRAPGVGVFAEYVDEKEAGEALVQGVNYLIDRFGSQDEVQLLREPEHILTPLFIELLDKACEKHRIVLMFDVFERTREALEPWLLELFNFKYGEFDTCLTFVISGRDSLDQRWTEIASSICHVTLEPFSLEETRLYLSNRSITDEQLVTQIHEDTGGLPVLVELLAGTNPKPGLPLPDISKDAVKRFLQWIPEEERRRVALLAAAPRQFNRDILGAALGSDGAGQFNWLSAQSYIRTSTTRGWFYHEKVRGLMLRYLRNTMPSDLATAHVRLAQFFETQQNELGLVDKAAYDSDVWRKSEVERVYHLLCAQPERNLGQVINAFLIAFRWRWRFAESIAQACQQAGHEMASQQALAGADTLAEFYRTYDKEDFAQFAAQANILSRRDDLNPAASSSLFSRRGVVYSWTGKSDQALEDLDRAIALDEKNDLALIGRGWTFFQMGKHQEALGELSKAIALDEKNGDVLMLRGCVSLMVGEKEQALSDLNRASMLNQTGILMHVTSYFKHLIEDRPDLAFADLDRVFAEKGSPHLAKLAQTVKQIRSATKQMQEGEHEQALTSLPVAFEQMDDADPAGLPQIVKQIQDAVKQLQVEDYEQALTIFDQISPSFDQLFLFNAGNSTLLRGLARICVLSGRYEQALAALNQVIERDEKDQSAIAWRGEIYRRLGHYQEAINDLTRSIELSSTSNSFEYSRRAGTYMAMGDTVAAEADIAYVMMLPLEDAADFYNKAVVNALNGHHSEAIELLKEAIKRSPSARSYAQRDDLLDPIRSLPEFRELIEVS